MLLATAFAALAAVTTSAFAAAPQRPPAGSPDPKQMVLKPADLGGARVSSQGYFRDPDFPSVSSYEREFESGRAGSAPLLTLNSVAQVGRSTQTTSSFLRTIKRLFGTREGRRLLRDSLLEETEGLVTNVRVGRPRALGVGPDSFDLVVSFWLLGLPVDAHFAVFRVEHLLGVLTLIGEPGEHVSLSAVTRLARIMAARMGGQLAPRNTVAPTVTGTAAVGQTLSASRGSWTGGATSFAFQWQRCEASGVSCIAIPGANGEQYVVSQADIGFRVRVQVSARGPSGTGTAVSSPTSVVPEIAPPTNVSPPTITGTPQSGQTLTAAGAGTWTGNPTGFSFQWLRCDAAGAACAPIPGATAATYVLGATDVGSTIRVQVTARNAAGDGIAVSAQTAVVT